tara:strand:+ start:6845 stop:7552 length:708 start_codon:yes stop_codon:yes gene_type:complete
MKVLIAEDDSAISGILEANLKHAGFETFVVENGLEVLSFFRTEPPDLVLLDVKLPGMDGYEVCKQLRQSYDIPIIMITAKTSEHDRLKGFEIGADDYICKPFSPREVIARINSIMRRVEKEPSAIDVIYRGKGKVDTVSEFLICNSSRTVMFMGQMLVLTVSEFNLLVTLISRPNRVFERPQLLDILAQHNPHCNDRAVDSHIKNLRHKLHKVAVDKTVIHTVYGLGYKFSYPIT